MVYVQRSETVTNSLELLSQISEANTYRLAACRRERMGSDASRSVSACVVHGTDTHARTASGRRQDRISDGDRTTWKDAPSPRYAQHTIWKRLRLNAKQTRHPSPPPPCTPRKENWRKPRPSLMRPITGSTVLLRAP